jgi:hypothetical protein
MWLQYTFVSSGFTNPIGCARLDDCEKCRHLYGRPGPWFAIYYVVMAILLNRKEVKNIFKAKNKSILIIGLLYVLPLLPHTIAQYDLDEKYCRFTKGYDQSFTKSYDQPSNE